jgi:hypothetical protein
VIVAVGPDVEALEPDELVQERLSSDHELGNPLSVTE